MSGRGGRVVAVVLLVGTLVAVVAELVLRPATAELLAQRSDLEHLLLMAVFVTFVTNGAIVLAHRPDHRIGWLLAAIGGPVLWITPLTTIADRALLLDLPPGALAMVGLWVNAWYWPALLTVLTFHLPVLFPDGHLPSPRWRWVARVVHSTVGGLVVMGMLAPSLEGVDTTRSVDNPIGVAWMPATEGSPLGDVLFLGVLVGLLAGVTALAVRFRRSSGVERQQLKLVLAGCCLLLLIPVGDVLDGVLATTALAGVGSLLFPVLIAGLPTAITAAVLRYRLWDIDRIVSRTISYVLVLGVLVAVYAGGVLGLGAAARAATGEAGDLVVALSTLAVAALFQPLRQRVREVVDRRFDRTRYDAAHTVDEFGRRLRSELGLERVVADLRTVAARTVQPSRAGVVLLGDTAPAAPEGAAARGS